MSKLSIRLRITLWFTAALVVIVGLTYAVILSVSNSVMQKSIQDSLIETVENNVDEIEFFSAAADVENDSDGDLYIAYNGGYLEIDDDFLDSVNGVSTALYNSDGTLLYGENPVSKGLSGVSYSDAVLQEKTVSGTVWYVFDRALTQDGLDGLWLRGVISAEQSAAQLSSVVHISMYLLPALLLLAVLGGYVIAGSSLRPIRKIADTAASIGHGRDLKKRIALGGGKDELNRLADTFDDMFARLDAAFEAERQFTSDASHELRTPVSVIMAQCEYTLEDDRSPEEYRDALCVIERQGRKMTRLISDLLSFTRLEQKADSYELKSLDLSELTLSVCGEMDAINDKSISLSAAAEPGVFINGNRDLIARLLTNLICNAYRYGREGGHIWVKLKSDAGFARLSVTDDGVGIAADEQEKIFRRFYQSSRSRSDGGTGLGLAMVREIAQLHGASVGVESALGEGSSFTCVFKIN